MINFVLGRKKKTEESVSFVKELGSDRDFDELRKLKDRIKEHYDMCLIKVDDVEKFEIYR